jgi:hypothetical protein
MKDRILRFLNDLDRALEPIAGGDQLLLYHIGRSALIWSYGFDSTTADLDFIHPKGADLLVGEAERMFGRGTSKARDHGLYLEFVPEGLPPVPAGAEKRAAEVGEQWTVIRLFHLEAHDLAVTKLKRFEPKDREDVRQLCDIGEIDPARLEESLEKAFRFSTPKDGDPHRDRAFAHLRRVQAYLHGETTDL